jgi:hypothetical protein
MPTALPVTIRALSPWYRTSSNTTVLVSRTSTVRLYGSAASFAYMPEYSYNWSTSNASALSTACVVASGPYLSLLSDCLASGSVYVFDLLVGRQDGIAGTARVSRATTPSSQYRL